MILGKFKGAANDVSPLWTKWRTLLVLREKVPRKIHTKLKSVFVLQETLTTLFLRLSDEK